MNAFAQTQGLPGMGYIFWRDEGGETGRRRPHRQEHRPRADRGDPAAAGPEGGRRGLLPRRQARELRAVAAKARVEIGRELGLSETDSFRFAWIVDFPMYEKDAEGRIDFSHNPFSMPQGGLEALSGDPLKVLGYQYDLACNGYEILSGAIRNHKPEIMFKAFELAGYGRDEVEKRFGGMVKAFRYGAPPHGGCAAGIDRIVMLLADEANIREVIMFPMNQRAEDLMMGAPSEPTPTNEQGAARCWICAPARPDPRLCRRRGAGGGGLGQAQFPHRDADRRPPARPRHQPRDRPHPPHARRHAGAGDRVEQQGSRSSTGIWRTSSGCTRSR
jgi:aspartyl-tRNA synthetase